MSDFKILSEEVLNIPPDWFICLFPIVIIVGIISLVLLANEYKLITCVFLILFFLGFLFIAITSDKVETEIKQYKVTPIIESYHIDLTKYEILEVEQNIITIRERVE